MINQNQPFWGIQAPVSLLSASGFILLASTRFSYGLIGSGALLWVYLLSSLALNLGSPYLSRPTRFPLMLLASSVLGSLYSLIVFLANPLIFMEMGHILILAPLCFACSAAPSPAWEEDLRESLLGSLRAAAAPILVALAISLIREPLGLGVLSLPGPRGILEILRLPRGRYFPIPPLSDTAGILLVLGYAFAALRHRHSRSEAEEEL